MGHPKAVVRASTHSSYPVPRACCSSTFLFDAMQPSLPHILYFRRSQSGFQKEGESENKNRDKELGDTFTPLKGEGLCNMTERKLTQKLSPVTSWVTYGKLLFLHCNIRKTGLCETTSIILQPNVKSTSYPSTYN